MTRSNRNRKPAHPAYADTRYKQARAELKTYDHTCHRCGRPIDMGLAYPHRWSWSCDHIIPKAMLQPGDILLWHISNLQAKHLICNTSEGTRIAQAAHPRRPTTYVDDKW